MLCNNNHLKRTLSPLSDSIIFLNSSKSISPLPSLSTSYISLSNADNSYPVAPPSASLSSVVDMLPLPSLSKNQNASLTLDEDILLLNLRVALRHSLQSMEPFPSKSAACRIWSTCTSVISPNIGLYPMMSSSLVNFPSLLTSSLRNRASASLLSSLDDWLARKVYTTLLNF